MDYPPKNMALITSEYGIQRRTHVNTAGIERMAWEDTQGMGIARVHRLEVCWTVRAVWQERQQAKQQPQQPAAAEAAAAASGQ